MTTSIARLFNLSDKTAIVTGAGQGMGQAIAFRLAEAGAAVVIAARQKEKGEATVAEIERRGGRAIAVAADVSVLADIDSIVDAAVSTFGGVDILINNAGGMHPFTAYGDFTEEIWQSTLDRNFKTTTFMSQRVLKEMVERGKGGALVNIASVEVERCFPQLTIYSAAKSAVESLTRSLAVEFAPHNIRINTIAPGPVRTINLAPVYDDPEIASVVRAKVPLGRIAEPDEIGTAALFLVSDAASYVTGAFLAVDGGFIAA